MSCRVDQSAGRSCWSRSSSPSSMPHRFHWQRSGRRDWDWWNYPHCIAHCPICIRRSNSGNLRYFGRIPCRACRRGCKSGCYQNSIRLNTSRRWSCWTASNQRLCYLRWRLHSFLMRRVRIPNSRQCRLGHCNRRFCREGWLPHMSYSAGRSPESTECKLG